MEHWVNPYSPNVTFLYPLKTSENRRFSDIFRGYRNVTLEEYELKWVKSNRFQEPLNYAKWKLKILKIYCGAALRLRHPCILLINNI